MDLTGSKLCKTVNFCAVRTCPRGFGVPQKSKDNSNCQCNLLDEQFALLEGKLLGTTIRCSEDVGQASVSGQTLLNYKPSTLTLADYKSLAKEVMQRLNV
ncbi:hypothetical protein TUM4637_36310 [Shewanella hafniensis]|uniref:ParA family protein n=1 Tax=Shewanella hafniensis TaxID=365590 RepID=UPI001BBF8E0B|nr:hypothetical protein [Shewanella hafniensis]MCL1136601.1 hypothetical protein [Shewanella hafniensis]GIU37192.1 hypothetical protein TUM4637_36310 [Shewanella hafniensis]